MTTTNNTIQATLTNSCQCHYCAECEVGYYGEYDEACPDCGTESEQGDYCTGDCWEYQKEGWDYLFYRWLSAHHSPRTYFIEGSNMGWRRVAGHTDKLDSGDAVLEALTGGFDFVLRCEFDPSDDTLTIVRSSHDEMGALFTVRECLECWYCGNGMNYDEVEGKWTDLSGGTECWYTEFGHFPNEVSVE